MACFCDQFFVVSSVCDYCVFRLGLFLAFSAFALAWEEHLACKKWLMWCWCCYLSGARCKWFAYVPSDATTTPSSASLKSRLV